MRHSSWWRTYVAALTHPLPLVALMVVTGVNWKPILLTYAVAATLALVRIRIQSQNFGDFRNVNVRTGTTSAHISCRG